MKISIAAVLLLAISASCGPRVVRHDANREQPQISSPIAVGLIVESLGREGLRVVQPGEIMCSHEQLLLRIEVSRDAYVYVVYGKRLRKGDEVQVLFPPSGDHRLRPEGFQRIPPIGQYLMLDDEPGQESLFVAVSDVPVARDRLIAQASAALQQPTIPPPNPRRVCRIPNSLPPRAQTCASKCGPKDWQCRAECSSIASGNRPAVYAPQEEEAYVAVNMTRYRGIGLTNTQQLGTQVGSIKLVHFPIIHR